MLERNEDLMSPFQPLSPVEKASLVLEILHEYLPIRRILRTKNVVEMVAAARDAPTRPSPGGAGPRSAIRLGRAVGRTLRLLPTDSRCLIQSLVLTRLLARRSIPHVLVIGIRNDPTFQAHAWVEHEGAPVLPAGRYIRLMEL